MSAKNWVGPTFQSNRAHRRAEEKASRKRQAEWARLQRDMQAAAAERKRVADEEAGWQLVAELEFDENFRPIDPSEVRP